MRSYSVAAWVSALGGSGPRGLGGSLGNLFKLTRDQSNTYKCPFDELEAMRRGLAGIARAASTSPSCSIRRSTFTPHGLGAMPYPPTSPVTSEKVPSSCYNVTGEAGSVTLSSCK